MPQLLRRPLSTAMASGLWAYAPSGRISTHLTEEPEIVGRKRGIRINILKIFGGKLVSDFWVKQRAWQAEWGETDRFGRCLRNGERGVGHVRVTIA